MLSACPSPLAQQVRFLLAWSKVSVLNGYACVGCNCRNAHGLLAGSEQQVESLWDFPRVFVPF